MPSLHQAHISTYHAEMANSGHHGSHNMHLFHARWHQDHRDPVPPNFQNPTWGTDIAFGRDFLQMHHEMIKAPDDAPREHMHHSSIASWYAKKQIPLPVAWDPLSVIPPELGYEPDAAEFPQPIRDALIRTAQQRGQTVEQLLTRRTDQPRLVVPPWFTREGLLDPALPGEPNTGARRLADFISINQLGCCLVYPHNRWHGSIGGAMNSFLSAIADPIFYFGVHWIIDRIYDEYKAVQAEHGGLESLPVQRAARSFLPDEEEEIREAVRVSREFRLGSVSLLRAIELGTSGGAKPASIQVPDFVPATGKLAKKAKGPSISWRQVPKSALESASVIRDALESSGIPTDEAAGSPKEDAISLLTLAAEVEHALMVQYLYAAFSLAQTTGSPASIEAAKNIVKVAIQEMGHLVTVQNLLLAVGGLNDEGRPAGYHLGRDSIRALSGRNPLRLVLEPLSHSALAKYVVVERPAVIPDEALRTRVEALTVEATEADKGFSPNPVSALYAAIRWIFQPTDQPFGAMALDVSMGFRPGWHLKPEDYLPASDQDRFTSSRDEWDDYPDLVAMPARDAAEACAALDAITEQGEGLPSAEASHFEAFLDLLDIYEANALPVQPLPRTPYIDGQTKPEDHAATLLTDEHAATWAAMFNLRYDMLLLDLGWGLSLPKDAAERKDLLGLTMLNMRKSIRGISAHLGKLTVSGAGSGPAGPPFGITDESMPGSLAEWKTRFQETRERMATLGAALESQAGLNAAGKILLRSLRDADAQREPFLPQP